jgi:hypothetical protein
MFLNRSSPPKLSVSSLTPNDLSSGRAGGGGPFFFGVCASAGCETVRLLVVGLEFSFTSGTVPTVFFFPNQLLLFLLFKVGAWLWMVAGEPGLSDCRLSDEESVRSPRNFRTDDGRRCGLVGESSMLLAASLVRGLWNCSPATASSCSLPFAGPFRCGKTSVCGVGCDDNGPFPGVGGRGLSGGESSGAGIDVPSVREKLMGVSVSGLYLPPAIMCVVLSLRRVVLGAIELAQQDRAVVAYV